MTRTKSRAGGSKQRTRQTRTDTPTRQRPLSGPFPTADNEVLRLQRTVGNQAVQRMIAAGTLDQPAVQRNGKAAPLSSLTRKWREQFGAAREKEAIKGIRQIMRKLRRSAKAGSPKAKQWRYAHAVTILRKYMVSGDMVSCYNALVTRLKLPGRATLMSTRYIGEYSAKQAPTVEAWWNRVSVDFDTLGKQLKALKYTAKFTKTMQSAKHGKIPVEAYFRTDKGKTIGPISWRQMVPAMKFLIQKHNPLAATPEDFVKSVLKSNMALNTRMRKALYWWSSNRMLDDRFMTRVNVSHVSDPRNKWKPGRVPDSMTSFSDKIHGAWSVASNYSRKSGPSKSKFIKEMEMVHLEVIDGIKAIIDGGHGNFYQSSNKQFKLLGRLKGKHGTVLNCLHKFS